MPPPRRERPRGVMRPKLKVCSTCCGRAGDADGAPRARGRRWGWIPVRPTATALPGLGLCDTPCPGDSAEYSGEDVPPLGARVAGRWERRGPTETPLCAPGTPQRGLRGDGGGAMPAPSPLRPRPRGAESCPGCSRRAGQGAAPRECGWERPAGTHPPAHPHRAAPPPPRGPSAPRNHLRGTGGGLSRRRGGGSRGRITAPLVICGTPASGSVPRTAMGTGLSPSRGPPKPSWGHGTAGAASSPSAGGTGGATNAAAAPGPAPPGSAQSRVGTPRGRCCPRRGAGGGGGGRGAPRWGGHFQPQSPSGPPAPLPQPVRSPHNCAPNPGAPRTTPRRVPPPPPAPPLPVGADPPSAAAAGQSAASSSGSSAGQSGRPRAAIIVLSAGRGPWPRAGRSGKVCGAVPPPPAALPGSTSRGRAAFLGAGMRARRALPPTPRAPEHRRHRAASGPSPPPPVPPRAQRRSSRLLSATPSGSAEFGRWGSRCPGGHRSHRAALGAPSREHRGPPDAGSTDPGVPGTAVPSGAAPGCSPSPHPGSAALCRRGRSAHRGSLWGGGGGNAAPEPPSQAPSRGSRRRGAPQRALRGTRPGRGCWHCPSAAPPGGPEPLRRPARPPPPPVVPRCRPRPWGAYGAGPVHTAAPIAQRPTPGRWF